MGIIANVLFFNMFIRLPILDKIFYLLLPRNKRAMYELIDESTSNDEEDNQTERHAANSDKAKSPLKPTSDAKTSEIVDEISIKTASRSTTPTNSRLKTKIV